MDGSQPGPGALVRPSARTGRWPARSQVHTVKLVAASETLLWPFSWPFSLPTAPMGAARQSS